MTFGRFLLAASVSALVGLIGPPTNYAPAQTTTAPPSTVEQGPSTTALFEEMVRTVSRLAGDLERTERAVERGRDHEIGLAERRNEIDVIQAETQKAIDALGPWLEAVRLQIEKLGKPPATEAAVAEAEPVTAERTRLTTAATRIDGAIKTAELTQERARQLAQRIQNLRHAIFARDLLRRTDSPLHPQLWRQVGEELPHTLRRIALIARGWWALAESRIAALSVLLGLGGGLFLALAIYGRASVRARLDRSRDSAPAFFARAGAAARVAVLGTLPAATAAAVLIGGLELADLMTPYVDGFVLAGLGAVVIIAAVSAVATAVLQPRRPNWRLISLSDRSAAQLSRLVRAIAIVFGVALILRETIRLLFLPLSMGVALSFVTSLAIAALLLGIVRTPLEPPGSAGGVSRYAPRWLKVPMLAVAAAIVAAALLGYVALGRFLAAQVVATGSIVVVAILLHLAIRAVVLGAPDGYLPVGRMLESQLSLAPEQRSQLSRILAIGLDFVLVLVAVPLLVLSWGFSWVDIRDWLDAAVFGFEIGTLRISLVRLLIALLFFLTVVLLTRLVQRWVAGAVVRPALVDAGIAHSIHAGVGYAGIALAVLIAVSYAGLDITNLAIVAGALSVGIGFGLQSIVNNFVSGLILLVERPIKVGDWIVVKGQEGYVRRISVRATEIETFDRASLIVPNTELITGTVMNWTHRNAIGRIVIRVGVSYDADPELVRDILLAVARASPSILQVPEPRVVLDDLGPSALEYSVRAYLADIGTALDAQTELRTAIVKALRAAGIAIPFAQHDVHLRDLDWVRQAVVAALAARSRDEEVKEPADEH